MLSWLFSDPLPPGTAAPDFTLPDQDGKPVSLSALRGHNVILVFYPGDDTPVCRRQLCELRDRWTDLTSAGMLVFGINPASRESHARFRGRNKFPFPLLVDRGKDVASLYNSGGLLWVKRTVYLIDAAGRIRYSRRGKPSPEEILAAIRPS
jgi:peroxiredoxin Q/BCP